MLRMLNAVAGYLAVIVASCAKNFARHIHRLVADGVQGNLQSRCTRLIHVLLQPSSIRRPLTNTFAHAVRGVKSRRLRTQRAVDERLHATHPKPWSDVTSNLPNSLCDRLPRHERSKCVDAKGELACSLCVVKHVVEVTQKGCGISLFIRMIEEANQAHIVHRSHATGVQVPLRRKQRGALFRQARRRDVLHHGTGIRLDEQAGLRFAVPRGEGCRLSRCFRCESCVTALAHRPRLPRTNCAVDDRLRRPGALAWPLRFVPAVCEDPRFALWVVPLRRAASQLGVKSFDEVLLLGLIGFDEFAQFRRGEVAPPHKKPAS
mmetsp:Transcript_728/g.1812  ORF Transcript_728/g.1812 Transcript_728/m.1812 type:complete len:319 (+) Transcript_728:300-1256(+)